MSYYPEFVGEVYSWLAFRSIHKFSVLSLLHRTSVLDRTALLCSNHFSLKQLLMLTFVSVAMAGERSRASRCDGVGERSERSQREGSVRSERAQRDGFSERSISRGSPRNRDEPASPRNRPKGQSSHRIHHDVLLLMSLVMGENVTLYFF